jgi:hypothetical protein
MGEYNKVEVIQDLADEKTPNDAPEILQLVRNRMKMAFDKTLVYTNARTTLIAYRNQLRMVLNDLGISSNPVSAGPLSKGLTEMVISHLQPACLGDLAQEEIKDCTSSSATECNPFILLEALLAKEDLQDHCKTTAKDVVLRLESRVQSLGDNATERFIKHQYWRARSIMEIKDYTVKVECKASTISNISKSTNE